MFRRAAAIFGALFLSIQDEYGERKKDPEMHGKNEERRNCSQISTSSAARSLLSKLQTSPNPLLPYLVVGMLLFTLTARHTQHC